MNSRLLTPFAIMQGLWLLRRAPTLPAPAGTSGRCGLGLGAALTVTGVGDSIMVGTGVREQRYSLTATFARLLHDRLARDVDWHVHGFNGATSAGVRDKVAPAAQAAHVYVLSCGVNDATRGVPASRFAQNLADIVQILRRKSPRAIVLYAGLPPLATFPALPWPLNMILAERVDALRVAAAEVIASDERAHCFQFPAAMPADAFASDGFHPAETACERWARGLLELWPPTAPA
jgi:lysophospholipase L1-like esterase